MSIEPILDIKGFSDFAGTASKSSLQKGAAAKSMRQLPDDFAPGERDVICGRGRNVFNHPGNEHFRGVVAGYLDKYNQAGSKLQKSYILSEIVTRVRELSPNGGFVKKNPKTGKWMEVGDFLAREKTSQAFRDALHDKYRSSNTAKKMRRQAEHQTDEERDFVEHNTRSLSDFETIAASLLGNSEAAPKPQSRLSGSSSLSSKLQNARSARSVLDFHSFKPSTEPKPAKNFNWSCPNLSVATNRSFAGFGNQQEEDLGGSMGNFDWSPQDVEVQKPRANPLLASLGMTSSMPSTSGRGSQLQTSNSAGNSPMQIASALSLDKGGSSALASFLSKNIGQQPIQESQAEEDLLDEMIGADSADALALESLTTMLTPDVGGDVRSASLQRLLDEDIMEATAPLPSADAIMGATASVGATGDTNEDSELFAKLVMITGEDMYDDNAFEPTPIADSAIQRGSQQGGFTAL